MPDVFLSHVEEDFPTVEQLAGGLEAAGYSTWYYERESRRSPGISHIRLTGEAIQQARAVVLFVSPSTLDSPWHVNAEVMQAVDSGKPIVPILQGVSYATFREREPDWHYALAGRVATDSTGGAETIIPDIVATLAKLGIDPSVSPPPRDQGPAVPTPPPAPRPKETAQVYLGHVEEDSELADRIATALALEGYSSWYYERDALPGPSYLLQTHHAIEGSGAIIVLISRESLASSTLKRDIDKASSAGKPIVPVFVDVTLEDVAAQWATSVELAPPIFVPPEGVSPRFLASLLSTLEGQGMEPRRHGPVIELVQGDITEQEVDAIVNAANSSLMGGGGVDGAIHRKGGPQILEECERIRADRYPDGLPTGQAVATTAGRLPATWVIHTVGPVYARSGDPARLLASCHTETLAVADELGARSIAFPAISTGAYGYPIEEAASIALRAVKRARTDVELVRFVLFDRDTYEAFKRASDDA